MRKKATIDAIIENHGTIFLVHPLTQVGRDWIREHIADDAQYLGRALAVEHRYIENIARGMQRDGLTIR